MNVYPLNQRVVCQFAFKNADGDLIDPSAATLKITAPDKTVTSYTLAQATRLSVGTYTVTVTGDQAGLWRYEADGDDGTEVDREYFRVVA